MAENERNTNGLHYEELHWCNRWKGTAQQLIEAGACELHQLPSQPGRNKNCVTLGTPIGTGRLFAKDEHYMQIQRIGRNRYMVTRHLPAEVERRRTESYFAELARERAEAETQKYLKTKLEFAEIRVDQLHKSPSDYRNSALGALGIVRRVCTVGEHGYCYDKATSTLIHQHIEALSDILASSRTIFDPSARALSVREAYQLFDLEPPPTMRSRPNLQVVQ